jgi:uncharacterized repeat protein (TIGR02543 family)
LDLGTSAGATNSSAIYGNSYGTAKNFVLLYDNTAGTGRPLACTDLEDDGVTIASLAAYYSTAVNGVSGTWGTIIPNTNINGVRRIEPRNYADSAIGYNTSADGNWPSGASTANPTTGTTAIAITSSDAPLVGGVTVTYNSNGSTGGAAPTDSNSPDNSGATVTVLDNTGGLTRTGYSFAGWNTAADGAGTNYSAGSTFTISAHTAPYAQWTPVTTCTVTYNGNGNTGGSPPTDPTSPYNYNMTVTLLGPGTLTRNGYGFTGWNTASDGSGTSYNAGATLAITSNVTFYAKWSVTPVGGSFTPGNLAVLSAANALARADAQWVCPGLLPGLLGQQPSNLRRSLCARFNLRHCRHHFQVFAGERDLDGQWNLPDDLWRLRPVHREQRRRRGLVCHDRHRCDGGQQDPQADRHRRLQCRARHHHGRQPRPLYGGGWDGNEGHRVCAQVVHHIDHARHH